MPFIPPVLLIRRNLITKCLKKSGAISPESAKTLAEAGVFNPDGFKRITDTLIANGVIKRTADGKYYIG